MDKGDVQEIYETRAEILGVDSADFIMDDATFVRIQIMVRGKVKIIPSDLVNSIAKLIREYELKKKEVT